MIRKILLGVLSALLAVLSYFTIAYGVSLGGFEAYGVSKLKQENDNVDQIIKNNLIWHSLLYLFQEKEEDQKIKIKILIKTEK